MPNIDLTFYKPLPSQDKLHSSDKKYKFYFGGFGTGKTQWLVMETLLQCLKYKKNYWIMLRRTYPELNDTLRKDFLEYCPEGAILDFKRTENKLTLVNGSIILFRSFDAIGKILSYNIGGFSVDQAEELPEDYFLALTSRLRLKREGQKYEHHGLLSMNPAGHNWCWRIAVRDYNDNDDIYDYVTAKSEENTHLPKGYIEGLRKIFPPQWCERYLDCGFADFEGMVFDNFGDKNIISKLPKDPSKVEYNIVTIDVGVDSPTAVLFSYFDMENSELVCYEEIYERNMTIKRICNLIKAKVHKWKLIKVWKYLIDPDAKKTQQTNEELSSKIQDFRSNGIPVLLANNNVDYGIIKTNELFGRKGEGLKEDETKILIYDKLKNFFNEIYEYVYQRPKSTMNLDLNSPGKPERKKNHVMDCLRYTVLGLPQAWLLDKSKREETLGLYQKYIKDRFERKHPRKPLKRRLNTDHGIHRLKKR